jgi:glycosyltransferase involved in cell wall biosynthesis
MRVLMVSKALVVGAYQRKLEEMAALPGVELVVGVPPYWQEAGNRLPLERSYTSGYALRVTPMRFNGHYHVHYYPQLGRLLDRVRPDILHIDEEPFNLATWRAVRQAGRRDIPSAFYSWQNIEQRFPPPFNLLEADVLRRAAGGLAGNHAALEILRRKGCTAPLRVVFQFGTDPDLFRPRGDGPTNEVFTIGFVGRLVPQKGLGVLLEALAGLDGAWRLEVLGNGPARERSEDAARRLGIGDRVLFRGQVPSTEVPGHIARFDVLVGPSLTTPRWKEQYGRMLVEAMSCEVPVIGSDSGEIPAVVGEAGLITPEGDAPALRAAIARLRDAPAERRRLGALGRRRVLERYTQSAVAAQTLALYEEAITAWRQRSRRTAARG